MHDTKVHGAPGLACRLREGHAACGVTVLQPRPRQARWAVVMLEHVHQLRWRRPTLHPSRENLRGGGDCSRVIRRCESGSPACAACALHEVVDEAHATAFPDRPHLVLAVRVERRVGQLRDLWRAEIDCDLASGVADDELAAAMRRRQDHDQGGEHARGFLGVSVRHEEPALVVHEKLVELRGDGARGCAKSSRHARHNRGERISPMLAAEPHHAWRQLPHLAHACIDDSVLAAPVRREHGPLDNAPCLRSGDWK